VRELENAIQRAVAVAEGVRIEAGDLPPTLRAGAMPLLDRPGPAPALPDGLTLAEMEALYIRRTVDRVGGNLSRAARELGISRSTLWRKLGRRGPKRSSRNET
jgi:transcriptional regulator of acetoin/glycerol metabolism